MSDFHFAIVADAHYHDIEADYGFTGMETAGRRVSLRSWSDTRLSTRVFNESHTALNAALDEIRSRDIRHVVLLGDYSDDGQRTTLSSLQKLLWERAERDGIRFYALPGNHDIFGPEGRHLTKEFLDQNGQRITVTSKPGSEAGTKADVTDQKGMFCGGYPEGLLPMAGFGYFRSDKDIYWETPFGTSDDPEDRCYQVVSQDGQTAHFLVDASYLVEPVPGVWLVMIDANVFEPKNGFAGRRDAAAFVDSSNAGWNGMIRHKAFIFRWLKSVSERARQEGKKVLVFSHYPALDPFDDRAGAEARLFDGANSHKRTPRPEVAQALVEAGVDIHFSGHLHVNGQTVAVHKGKALTNVAVPSLVAYPPAFKCAHLQDDGLSLQDVVLDQLELDEDILAGYEQECLAAGETRGRALETRRYGDFLIEHLGELAERRYLPREWPRDCREAVLRHSLAEICVLAGIQEQGEAAEALPMMQVVRDWYLLRASSNLAFPAIAPERVALYQRITHGLTATEGEERSVDGFFRLFFQALGHFLARAEKVKPFLERQRENTQQADIAKIGVKCP